MTTRGPIERGVCQFCRITADRVDGDKVSWFDALRTCCNGSACVRAYHENEKKERERIERFNRKCRAEARDRRRQDLERRGLLKKRKGAA